MATINAVCPRCASAKIWIKGATIQFAETGNLVLARYACACGKSFVIKFTQQEFEQRMPKQGPRSEQPQA